MARILVAEDDRDLLYLYRTALAHAGYDVMTADTGHDVRLALQEDAADIVFLDMNMPGIHGIDLIDYIHNDRHWAEAQIVVITANEQWHAPAKARGIELFLVKPISIRDLVAVADRLTG